MPPSGRARRNVHGWRRFERRPQLRELLAAAFGVGCRAHRLPQRQRLGEQVARPLAPVGLVRGEERGRPLVVDFRLVPRQGMLAVDLDCAPEVGISLGPSTLGGTQNALSEVYI